MEGIQQLLGSMNTRVLKEPRGFMKILQFVFGISAFASTTSFSTSFAFLEVCPEGSNVTISESISYPYEVDAIRPVYDICDNNKAHLYLEGDFSSDSRFFVAVGVIAFLYTLAALALYCLFYSIYDNNPLAPLGDCAAHIILTILWLAGSSAWANSLTALRQATSLDAIMKENHDICEAYKCIGLTDPNYAKLVISIILGFLNVFLWGSNLWFLYKETHFFKAKNQNPEGAEPNTMPVP